MNQFNYLMIKKCTVNGKKYLCKRTTTTDEQAIRYKGSGIWVSRLKRKYGASCIVHDTILCKMPIESENEFKQFCLQKSIELNVVESCEWLNLVHETGCGGSVKGSNPNIGRKTIHKGDAVKVIHINDLEKYINDGWILGHSDRMRRLWSIKSKGQTAHNKGKKMKAEHEYKTAPYIKKTEEEKFKNRSEARRQLYQNPEYLSKFKKPKKPLITIINKQGETQTLSRSELALHNISPARILAGTESNGWKLI